nr:hypothetical protein [Tanacetum cinerariifolium]
SWGDVRSGGSGEEWGKWRLQAWREKGECTVVLKLKKEQGLPGFSTFPVFS